MSIKKLLSLHSSLKGLVPFALKPLSPAYRRFFCTQMVGAFIPRFKQTVYACKRISELGTQQMSLDALALKSVLLALPQMESIEAKKQPTTLKLDQLIHRFRITSGPVPGL